MSRTDPYPAHRFQVEIDGLLSAGFAEVEGLAVTAGVFADPDEVPEESPTDERDRAGGGGIAGAISRAMARTTADADRATWVDPENWPELVNWTEPGSSNPPPRQRRGEFPLLTLRRGITDSRRLESWIDEWIQGDSHERAVRITLLDGEGEPVRGWECEGAVPVRWTGPTLRANREGVAMESIDLAHAGLTAVAVEH